MRASRPATPAAPRLARALAAVAAAMLAALLAAGCSAQAEAQSSEDTAATVQPVPGSTVSRVTLTERAIERLGIVTAPVQAPPAGRQQTLSYAALIYDAEGGTWVYTSPAPRVYVRAKVDVAAIQGDDVVLAAGLPSGTAVVIVGAAELFGAELGVDH